MGASPENRNIGGGNESTGFNIGSCQAFTSSHLAYATREENGPTPVLFSLNRRIFA
jgi:hypothetical protein